MDIFEKTNEYIAGTYKRSEIALESGNNFTVIDESGKKYIDFGSGIGTNSLGYCDEDWVEAVCNQIKTLQHTSNYFYNAKSAELAEMLCKTTGYKKVFFGNSGAEANECAIKTARKYSYDKYGKGRSTIITLVNSFHGRTIATLSATGQDNFHDYFFPFVEGFVYAEANNIGDLKSKVDSSVCAIMFEHIQGEGGVVPLEQSFVDAIYELAEANDIVTIADEVQTGVGRTGKFLAAEYYGKKADITTLAKGVGGGLPIGICVMGEKCENVLSVGTHGSTFGGNPVACAGGITVMQKITALDFLNSVVKKGEYIKSELQKLPEVESITGLGLMIGVKFKNKSAKDIYDLALDKGLLTLTAKDKLRLLPPLSISEKELKEGMKILTQIIKG